MFPKRLNDFVSDQRFLWNPLKKDCFSARITKMEKLSVVLTVDVEQDYGSKGGVTKLLSEFLKSPQKIIGKKKATLFIQGEIISNYQNELIKLEEQFELGSHGFSHRGLWGKPVWFLNEESLNPKQKEEELEKSLQAFEKAGLQKPLSFRAPNLVINAESKTLLNKYGFKIDSSDPSFRSISLIYDDAQIKEIPVSNFSPPSIGLISGILCRNFYVLNMGNLLRMESSIWQPKLKTYINNFEINHLVFLCHSWDINQQKLQEFTRYLENNWNINYLTMQELSSKLWS